MADLHKPVPAAWIDESGHPRHLSYLQGARERRLYGPLRPLYGQQAIDVLRAALRRLVDAADRVDLDRPTFGDCEAMRNARSALAAVDG